MAQPGPPPPYSAPGPYDKPPPYAPGGGDPNHYAYPQQPSQPGWGHQQTTTTVQYGSVLVEPMTVPATQVIIVGGCPSCRVGVLQDSFSCLGILCAIVFFPIGILCCLVMRDKRCSNCGASF